MKENNHIPLTPSALYRKQRPEYFSDSEKVYEVKLTREHLAYELSQISTNQKQDAFESFCRRLAEKCISPNLIPQVGPTGGGDGKTDSETHPVSESISDRWFIPENGWQKDENWAFAISAKKDWRTKVKSDVANIVKTNRGYTKIYFLTNQWIASKKKKDVQDEFKIQYKLDVIILDGGWIIEKIFSNNLINLAVDSLNLSDVYKTEKLVVGENDASRNKRLSEIENNIINPKRYFEYDHQLVEDALESAIVSRMLEKPKEEVVGKFERALRFAMKLNNKQQLQRIHYQRAWTYLQWYDDYQNFISAFLQFKEYAKQDVNTNCLELYFNLLNILRGIAQDEIISKEIPAINYQTEEDQYRAILENCITNENKPSTSLIARTYKSFLNIFQLLLIEKEVSKELDLLQNIFTNSPNHLEYPFESFKNIIEIFGELLPESTEYDNLIDCIAELSEIRASELAAGVTYLKRGIQKKERGYNKESLIYFGKSVQKLAKEESQQTLYFALKGLTHAYDNLGLSWAANNSLMAAANITIKDWYNTGKPNISFFRCVKEFLKKELFIGRIPHMLCWYEIFNVISSEFEKDDLENETMPLPILVDSCLSVRLLNSPYSSWKNFSILPDIFEKQTLWLSQSTSLYLLGYGDLLEETFQGEYDTAKTIDEYYNMVANQPFKEQMIHETNLLDTDTIKYKSVILGTNFILNFKKNKEEAILAEIILAFLESFLATSFEEVHPTSETIVIQFEGTNEIDWYKISQRDDNNTYIIKINLHNDNKKKSDKLYRLLREISANIISKNFIIKDPKTYLDNLYNQEELHERQSIIIEHRKFFGNIFGEKPKIFIEDWAATDAIKIYNFKRTNNPILIKESSKETNFDSYNGAKLIRDRKHTQTIVSSIIDTQLWDQALWRGFGFFVSPEFPLGIFLAFENGEFGKQIFEGWIRRFGKIDSNEEINISIIRGIDVANPHWYRVHISKSVKEDELKDGQVMVSASRFHEMHPDNPENLPILINRFNQLKQYYLIPVTHSSDRKIEPHLNCAILKRKLTVRSAWEIGENDPDRVTIRSKDNPFIPVDKPDAPIINLLKILKDETRNEK